MELGNMIFGNSRGKYPLDRSAEESKEWNELLKLLGMDSYGIMTEGKGLDATEWGGYLCKDKDDKTIFEIFPYYWGECTCNIDETDPNATHSPDCLLCKHNFTYMPGTPNEINIDWYKYPFRDSYISRNITTEELNRVFQNCIDTAKNKLNDRG